jgi:hypothetical protein
MNKIRNPNIEIRNKLKEMNPKPTKSQNTNSKHRTWKFPIFEHLDLFRISDFAFRIYSRGKELKND